MTTNRKGAGRDLRRMAGVTALSTSFLALAMQPATAIPAQHGAAVDPETAAASFAESEIDTIRRSGDPQLVLDFLRRQPDRDLAEQLIVTLPREVAREVLAGLRQVAAVSEPAKPVPAPTPTKAGPKSGTIETAPQSKIFPEYGNPVDVNPGPRTGGY